MMDIVYIRELEIRTIIGVFDWERDRGKEARGEREVGKDNR